MSEAADASASRTGKCSPVRHTTYSQLATSPTDMIGHVAYALYKRDKLLFCERTESEKGRSPSNDEIDAFIQSSHVRLGSYRSEAEHLLAEFAQEAFAGQLQEETNRIEREYFDKLEEKRGFWRAVRENIVANIGAAGILALLFFIAILSRDNAGDHFARLLGYVPQSEVNTVQSASDENSVGSSPTRANKAPMEEPRK